MFTNRRRDNAELDRLIALGYIDPGDEHEAHADAAETLDTYDAWLATVTEQVRMSPNQRDLIGAIVQEVIERLPDAGGDPIQQDRIGREMRRQVLDLLDEIQRAALSAQRWSSPSAARALATPQGS